MTPRLRSTLTSLLVSLTVAANAATQEDLRRVDAALRHAASPWCGRLAEIDAQGQRRCTVPFESVGPIGAGNAFAVFDMTRISDELLAVLSEDELAAAMGHELAHVVLGHGIFRMRQQIAKGPDEAQAMLLSLNEQFGIEPHADTPQDLRAQELDADTLGLVFAGLAGYDVHRGAALWRTASQRIPGMKSHGATTHPENARRHANGAQVARSFCRAVYASRPPWPATERLLPRYELSRDEAARQLDPALLTRACGKPNPARMLKG
ncbi:M48 family metalloprotease [Roseateles sp. P5_E1]